MASFVDWKNEKEQRLIYLDELNRKKNLWLSSHSSELEGLSKGEREKKIIDLLKNEMSLGSMTDEDLELSLIVSQLYELTQYTTESVAPTLEERRETFENLESILDSRDDDLIHSKLYIDSSYSDFLLSELEKARNKGLREETSIEKTQIINEIEQVKSFIDDVLTFRKVQSLSDDKAILTYKGSMLKPLFDKKKELSDSLAGIDNSSIAGIILSSELLEVNKKIDEINNTDISSKDAKNYLVDLLIEPSHRNYIVTYEYAKTLESAGITDYNETINKSTRKIDLYDKIEDESRKINRLTDLKDKIDLLKASDEYQKCNDLYRIELPELNNKKTEYDTDAHDMSELKRNAVELERQLGGITKINKDYRQIKNLLEIEQRKYKIFQNKKKIADLTVQMDNLERYFNMRRNYSNRENQSEEKKKIHDNSKKEFTDKEPEIVKNLVDKIGEIFGDDIRIVLGGEAENIIDRINTNETLINQRIDEKVRIIDNSYSELGTTPEELPLSAIQNAKSNEQRSVSKVVPLQSYGNIDTVKENFNPLVTIDGFESTELTDRQFYDKVEESVSRKR